MNFDNEACEALVRKGRCDQCSVSYCEKWDDGDGVDALEQAWDDDYEFYLQSLEDEETSSTTRGDV